MSLPNAQPTLPVEGIPTDLEQVFITEQPTRLFPRNQNSNFGLFRKLISQELQEAADKLTELFNEEFIPTADGYLGRWEDQMGLPKAPTGYTVPRRRVSLLSRRGRAPFTKARVNSIIERFIMDTFGAGSDFGSTGLSLVTPGIPLFSGTTSLIGSYRVYYNPLNYTYTVWIKNTITPDIAGLTRELNWITPGGIAFTIDNTNANVMRYASIVQNSAPVHYWRLATLNDIGSNPAALTANGGVVAGSVAAPGLLQNVTVAGNEGATTFDGVNDYFSASPSAAIVSASQFTFEAWVKINTLAALGQYRMMVRQNSRYLALATSSGPIQQWAFTLSIDGVQTYLYATRPVVVGTTYHVAGTFDGVTMKLYENGVLVGSSTPGGAGQISVDGSPITIGEYGLANYMDGVIDEVAVYNRALSAAEILDHYNTGKDIATY